MTKTRRHPTIRGFVLAGYPYVLVLQVLAYGRPGPLQAVGETLRGVFLAALCVLTLVGAALSSRSLVIHMPKATTQLLLLSFPFLGWAFAGAIQGTESTHAGLYVLWHLVGLVFNVAVLGSVLSDPVSQQALFRRVTVVCAGFASLSLVMAVASPGTAFLADRLSGYFFRPNSLAIVASVGAIGAVAQATSSSRKQTTAGWILVSAICISVLTLSRTRAALFGFLVIVLTWLFFRRLIGTHKPNRLLQVFGLVGGLAATLVFVPEILGYFRLDGSGGQIGQDRLALWSYGVTTLPSVGPFGVGLGSQESVWMMSGATYLGLEDFGFHNSYLQAALETGVVGLVLWLLPLSWLLLKSFARAHSSMSIPPYVAASFALLCGLLVNGFFESALIIPSSPSYPFVWVAATILSVWMSYSDREVPPVADSLGH